MRWALSRLIESADRETPVSFLCEHLWGPTAAVGVPVRDHIEYRGFSLSSRRDEMLLEKRRDARYPKSIETLVRSLLTYLWGPTVAVDVPVRDHLE